MALFADGSLNRQSSILGAAQRAFEIIKEDVLASFGEISEVAAGQVVQKANVVLGDFIERIAHGIRDRGPAAVWGDLQDMYRQGVESKRAKSSRRQ